MILLSALLLLPAYGSGASAAPAPSVRPVITDRDTLPLVAAESLVFVGISGDFSGDREVALQEFLAGELKLTVVGGPVRSLSDRDRMVWALRTDQSPQKLERALSRPLKKKDYRIESLRATAISLLGNQSFSQLQRGLRAVERADDRAWAFHIDSREGLVWAFHESKLDSERLLGEVRDAGLKASFHHQELELEAKEGAEVQMLVDQAQSKLDLLRATGRDRYLVLDLYLRDVEAFLALDRGKKTVACPDVMSFLAGVPAGNLSWVVTLENRGYPFVN